MLRKISVHTYAWKNIPGPCGDAAFDAQHMSLADWKAVYGNESISSIEVEVDGSDLEVVEMK